MRCLWITRQDPRPANSGELIYTNGLITALKAHRDIELTVLAHRARGSTASSGEEDGVHWKLPGEVPRKNLDTLLSPLPGDSLRLGNPLMRASLAKLLESHWDWVLIDQAACGWALPLIPRPGPRIAYVAHNHEASVRSQIASESGLTPPLSWLLKWDAVKYARLEKRLARTASLLTAITAEDEQAFREEFPDLPTVVLTPGHEQDIGDGPDAAELAARPRRVVLTGAFEWIAKRRNLHAFLKAADEVFPAAGIEFQVVGKANPAYFSGLAGKHPWAEFEANVWSIAPYLGKARIGLIPDALGGGFKLKALDYILAGLPMATVTSALRGLPIDPESECVAADTPQLLAHAIATVIDDTAFLHRAARAALVRCRDAFHWADRGAELARALNSPSS